MTEREQLAAKLYVLATGIEDCQKHAEPVPESAFEYLIGTMLSAAMEVCPDGDFSALSKELPEDWRPFDDA